MSSNPGAQRLGELQIRLDPLQDLVLADVDHRRIVGERQVRVVRIRHVDLRHPPGDVRLARSAVTTRVASDARASSVRVPGPRLPPPRPSTIGRSKLGVARTELIDHEALFVDEKQPAVDPANHRRRALGHENFDRGRQRPPQHGILHPGRRQQTRAPGVEVGPHQVLTLQPVHRSNDGFARHALVPLHHDPIDLKHPGMRDDFDAAVEHQRRERDDDDADDQGPSGGPPPAALATSA